MARTKAGAGGQQHHDTDDKTVEGVAHDHGDGDTNHFHRLGDLPHLHSEDGKAVLLDEHGKPLFTEGQDEPRTVNTEQARELLRTEAAEKEMAERRVTALKAEAAEIEARRPDAITRDGPRPVSVSGAPGSRQADVISRMHALAFEGYPAEVQDEVIWTEIATHALVSMREEQARTKRHADPALVAAVLDAADHIARARGLVRGGGS
jgi:hypothetical protein